MACPHQSRAKFRLMKATLARRRSRPITVTLRGGGSSGGIVAGVRIGEPKGRYGKRFVRLSVDVVLSGESGHSFCSLGWVSMLLKSLSKMFLADMIVPYIVHGSEGKSALQYPLLHSLAPFTAKFTTLPLPTCLHMSSFAALRICGLDAPIIGARDSSLRSG